MLLDISSLSGAPPLLYSQINDVARQSPELIIWAAPVMFFLFYLSGLFHTVNIKSCTSNPKLQDLSWQELAMW